MKLRILLWVCFLGLVLGVVALYSLNRKQQADLAVLRRDTQELQDLRAQLEDNKAAAAEIENAELTRLRKENEELLRLRNEVRQLRDEKQKLGKEVQTAQASALTAQAQAQNAQAQAQALRASAAQAAQQVTQQASAAQQLNGCINNLRQIDGAKQQWALENRKTAEAVPNAQDLAPYLRGNAIPPCPSGGGYTLNAVSLLPTCSIPGHTLPK
jgi:chromosome segregation ATPase